MTIIQDPEGDITKYSDIYEFVVDQFDDINSPQYYISKSAEDLASKILVLDGHSTVLLFTQDAELPWEAVHELGQYLYTPEKVGDGLVSFPHSCYFEVTVELTSQKLTCVLNLDANDIKALILPMKDVTLKDLFDVLQNRLSDALTSVLKPIDDQLDIQAGQVLKIPSSVVSKLGMKLALLGLNITKITVNNTVDLEIIETQGAEEIFEKPRTKAMDDLAQEEKDKKLTRARKLDEKRKIAESKRKSAMKKKRAAKEEQLAKTPSAPPVEEASTTAPTPSAAPAPPPSSAPAAPQSGIPSPGGAVAGSAPPPVSAAPPSTRASSAPDPPKVITGLPAPSTSQASAPAPITKSDDRLGGAESGEMEERILVVDDEDISPAEIAETIVKEKYAHASYFERMIPNRVYPLIVSINTVEKGVKKSVSSVISGERISEIEESLQVDTTKGPVTIKPEFPGCLVVPTERQIDPKVENVKIRFHVTPLVIGKLEATINFYQNKIRIAQLSVPTKVINHRITRWMAIFGALIGAFPAIIAFIFNETPANWLDQRFAKLIPAFDGLGYILPGLLTAIFLGISGGLYFTNKPGKNSRTISFPR